jgi:hypothetical protein
VSHKTHIIRAVEVHRTTFPKSKPYVTNPKSSWHRDFVRESIKKKLVAERMSDPS